MVFLFLSFSKIERVTPVTISTTTITTNKELSLAGGHAVLSGVVLAHLEYGLFGAELLEDGFGTNSIRAC
jgi:hypothetical protein